MAGCGGVLRGLIAGHKKAAKVAACGSLVIVIEAVLFEAYDFHP